MAELIDMLKTTNDIYTRAFEAGHKAGYRLGYQEASKKAQELVEEVLGPLTKKQAE